MVYHLPSSISVCKSVDQTSSPMASLSSPSDPPSGPTKSNNHHLNKSRKIHQNSTPNPCSTTCCDRSRSGAIDVVIFIAVIVALGFLILPSLKFLFSQSVQILGTVKEILRDEVSQAPLVYGSVGLSACSAVLAAWGVIACTTRKCGNPNCKGLRKAAEFDIQLETEDCLKNHNNSNNNNNHHNNNNNLLTSTEKKGLFELPRDHHRELEAELKKMAPPNGRAVLVFRARCGCSLGRLEVPGPKKHRKIKK